MLKTTAKSVQILDKYGFKFNIEYSKNYQEMDDEIKLKGTSYMLQCGKDYVLLAELDGQASYDIWYVEITPRNNGFAVVDASIKELKENI